MSYIPRSHRNAIEEETATLRAAAPPPPEPGMTETLRREFNVDDPAWFQKLRERPAMTHDRYVDIVRMVNGKHSFSWATRRRVAKEMLDEMDRLRMYVLDLKDEVTRLRSSTGADATPKRPAWMCNKCWYEMKSRASATGETSDG